MKDFEKNTVNIIACTKNNDQSIRHSKSIESIKISYLHIKQM